MASIVTEWDSLRLMRRLKDRDHTALGELYDCYGRLAFHVILMLVGNRDTAEDLTQETFLRIWNSAAGFDGTRGSVKTWVLVVARNRAIDFLRSAEGRMVREAVDLESAGAVTFPARSGRQLLGQETSHLLAQAMARLTANQRLVLDLCYWEGMTQEEIADRLQRPLGTVKTWVRKALGSLRTALEAS
jgi:RNA polymerase sigma-70 factor (ECF subfamily)